MQIPNSKTQIPNKFEIPNSKVQTLFTHPVWNLDFWYCLGFGIW